jgi:Fe-S-cluster containining protein
MSFSSPPSPPPLAVTRQHYRHVFTAARQALFDILDRVRPDEAHCPQCQAVWDGHSAPQQQPIGGHALFLPSHKECGWHVWREAGIEALEQEIGPQLLAAVAAYQADGQTISCQQTGSCCRLASSPYSWPQLQAKALAGDDFAQQFTGIFLPYPSEAQAEQRCGTEAVADVLAFGQDEAATEVVHFYYCPHLQPDNRCGLFGTPDRPEICSTYPNNPLTYVAKTCAWAGWQNQWHEQALMVHASIALCQFALERLRAS